MRLSSTVSQHSSSAYGAWAWPSGFWQAAVLKPLAQAVLAESVPDSATGALCSCFSQRRTRLELRPWASATAATEAPGCWQARITWRLRLGAWRRRARFDGVLCIVSLIFLGGHHGQKVSLDVQDGTARRSRFFDWNTLARETAQPTAKSCDLCGSAHIKM